MDSPSGLEKKFDWLKCGKIISNVLIVASMAGVVYGASMYNSGDDGILMGSMWSAMGSMGASYYFSARQGGWDVIHDVPVESGED